jgi:hypothetical protein
MEDVTELEGWELYFPGEEIPEQKDDPSLLLYKQYCEFLSNPEINTNFLMEISKVFCFVFLF